MANLKASHKSGFLVRGGVRRRQMLWIGGTADANTIASSTAVLLTSLNAAALALRPFTIVRTRGMLYLATDQQAALESQTVNYGRVVVTDQAVAIGVSAVPTPVTDDVSDWFVFETLMAEVRVVTAASVFEVGRAQMFDSKAMRKVDLGDQVISVVEVNAAGVSDGVRFRNYARTLVKLH